ncbi:MAG: hypothetical protein KDB82_09880 [Planctomycetes bacterium]|nr:hypothetical protein [Planctomycetota bacterium]
MPYRHFTAATLIVAVMLALCCCGGRIHRLADTSKPEPVPANTQPEPEPANSGADDNFIQPANQTDSTPDDAAPPLPPAAPTGAMPTVAVLLDAVKEAETDGGLSTESIRAIRIHPSRKEKKATLGALIDLLLKAVNRDDRKAKAGISEALWTIWNSFCYQDQTEDKMIYSMGFDNQNSSDLIVRRWVEVYNGYKVDE